MKITHLHINNFGHFADRRIVFADALRTNHLGLQIIHGPNEAGKSTLLEFVRGWLFDFPIRTPYDFKAGIEIAGVGTLLLADGREVELRRRKGSKNKVSVKIDGSETSLDEAGFQRLIGDANRNLFESVFAFGLEQLSQGEESLKHESLQSALFGSGLGSAASPERIGLELDRQAGELFSPNARKPAINQLLGELKDLASQIKGKTLRSGDYQKCQEAVEATEARAAEIRIEVDRLRHEQSRAQKLARAWPKWWELRQQVGRRAALSVPTGLPPDARQRFVDTVQPLADAERDRQLLIDAIARDEQNLAELRLNPPLVALRAEIKVCLELRKSTVEARRDLPKLTLQCKATEQQIDRELHELRPGWRHEELRAFSVDEAMRATINRLADEDRAIDTARTRLWATRDELQAGLVNAEADLSALGNVRDAAPLVAVLDDESAHLTDLRQLENKKSELAKVDRQLATALRKLTPPLATGKTSACVSTCPISVGELPVPRRETIAGFEKEFTNLGQELRDAIGSLRDDETAVRELQDKLAQAASARAVPSLTERDARRRRRDKGWDLIRRRYIDGQPAPEDETAWLADASGSLVDGYPHTVREADEIADEIYGNADAVARREALERDLSAIAKRIEAKQARVDKLQRKEVEFRCRWLALWERCGFEPLAPDAMRHWLADHEALCETIGRRDELTAELDRLAGRKMTFEERLRATCGRPDADISVLLTAARQAVDGLKERKRIKPRLAGCDRELNTLDQREAAWRGEWQSVLAALHFPTDWPTELARTVIERLTATRVKLDGLADDIDRTGAMQARIDEFESQVRSLCERLAPELLRDPPELAFEKLSEQLDAAIEAQRQHDTLEGQLMESRRQSHRLEERRTALLANQTALFAAADAASEAEFLEAAARGESVRALDAAIERLSGEIELIRAGDDCEAFEQLLLQVDQSELDSQCRELAEQLQTTESQKRDADGAAAVARSELARLDGSEEAALLTQTRARKRAELAADVDRYVPLLLARHLLGESVRRFERENQPELIKTVSRLIREITAGRYIEFDRTDRKEIILRRSDGVERTPSQLSVGTHNQLYLAIRLAYVMHYCQQNEPLPIVMDDVLVNFDEQRACQTLAVLNNISRSVQVLFFTCHPHMVALAKQVVPDLQPIELSALGV
ncbi:MAG TPA: AAA family ATPase [Pirellulales bacterium]|nr:AAA family ATPase [Pirellulales bacterium]